MKPTTLLKYTALTSAARHSTVSALAAFLLLALGQMSASAQISVSNFLLTSNSVSFSLSGTLPNPAPQTNPQTLYFVNPNVAASPGFALSTGFFDSSTQSFTGTQALRSIVPLATGNHEYGDYFYVAFENALAVGETIDGIVSATWSAPAFDPAAVASLNLFWGVNDSLPFDPSTQPSLITGGTFLTSVVVPEPSTYALLLMTSAGALWWTRRRMGHRSR